VVLARPLDVSWRLRFRACLWTAEGSASLPARPRYYTVAFIFTGIVTAIAIAICSPARAGAPSENHIPAIRALPFRGNRRSILKKLLSREGFNLSFLHLIATFPVYRQGSFLPSRRPINHCKGFTFGRDPRRGKGPQSKERRGLSLRHYQLRRRTLTSLNLEAMQPSSSFFIP